VRGVVNERHNYSAFVYNQASRASERSEAIKDDFHRAKFLIPVTNASTGDVYVTTPCSSCKMACMTSVTIPLHG